jgi:peptidoglycan/xylan/chitin deacetylase (PgdA/CDA1 family)
MRADDTIYLMYHEIEVPSRPLCQSEAGYVRYVVTEKDFNDQLRWLQTCGIRGASLSQALAETSQARIVLTFDDGCASDLLVAATLLQKYSFGATFYITLGFLGRSGYMVAAQVRELSDAGFDIGCHSKTHPYLDELDDSGLRREIADSKSELEDMIGRPVRHFSCPGGRWSPAVARVARESGYVSVATSRVGVNHPDSDPFRLSRIAVMRGTPLVDYQASCRGRNLWQRQLRDFVIGGARRVLGNAFYDRIRGATLSSRSSI